MADQTAPQQPTTDRKLLDFRIERYEDMKFLHVEAVKLANSRGDDGFYLDYRKVKKALDGGCSHKMAIRIFENLPADADEEEDQKDSPRLNLIGG